MVNSHFFDTLTIDPLHNVDLILERAGAHSVNFRRYQNDNLGISINETTTREDIEELFDVLLGEHDLNASVMDADLTHQNTTFIPENLERTQPYLTHPVFNSYHSETDMLRYLKKLENRDLALDHLEMSALNARAEPNAVGGCRCRVMVDTNPKKRKIGKT